MMVTVTVTAIAIAWKNEGMPLAAIVMLAVPVVRFAFAFPASANHDVCTVRNANSQILCNTLSITHCWLDKKRKCRKAHFT